ncbi:Clavesin-1 [Gracilaria domingensis]|nr:Clavesin-1 [Gracilaria domingensis]
MQQPVRPGRPGRSARAHAKHQSVSSSSDSVPPAAADAHPPSEHVLHDVPKPSARPSLPPAALRARRTYPRHRKPKNRPDHPLEAVNSAPVDTKHSDQHSATSLANPAPQEVQSLASALPSTKSLLTKPDGSVHVTLTPQLPTPMVPPSPVSQLTVEMQNVSLSSSSSAHPRPPHPQQQQQHQHQPPLQPQQQQHVQQHPQQHSQQQALVSPIQEASSAQHSPGANSSRKSPASPSGQPSHVAEPPHREQPNAAHKSPMHPLPPQLLQQAVDQHQQLPMQMQVPNHMAMHHMSVSQAMMHPQRQVIVHPQYCSSVNDAAFGSDTKAVNITAHNVPVPTQPLQLPVPSNVDRSAAQGASQPYVFTRTMNVSSATVPYQLVSPSSQPQGQQFAPASGSTSQTQTGKHSGEDAVAASASSLSKPVGRAQASESTSSKKDGPAKEGECGEADKFAQFVSRVKASVDSHRARPRICQDINNSNADTLRISRLPRGVTYDRLYSMVEPFGEVEELSWSASDPYLCEVTYTDPAAAHEAKHFLGDALVGSDSEPPLKAELHSRDAGAQLFVGDLTPDVTEEMLEATFSNLVGEPVTALLKRDPDSFSPIGYGFLSFKSESSANFALVAGHRAKVGNANVRVGRAERNTYLYVSDLSPNVSMSELKDLFGRFGSLVEEDTVIIRRSYAFVRYKNRNAAEKAKRTLDKTDLKGRLSVRYAEAEPLKACVAVQFHSSVPRPPNSLRDLLTATFSKHGNCSVEIPRLTNGMWRKVAFVTFHGDPMAANAAALEAVQSIRFVSSLPVCCQFARELIPRLPSKGLTVERGSEANVAKSNLTAPSERVTAKLFQTKKNNLRRSEQLPTAVKGNSSIGQGNPENLGSEFQNDKQARGPNLVPIYVPITALQHPNSQLPPGSIVGTDNASAPYQWSGRVLIPGGAATDPMGHSAPTMNATYNSFGRMPEPRTKW